MTAPDLTERLRDLARIIAMLYGADAINNGALRDSSWALTEAAAEIEGLKAERDTQRSLADNAVDKWERSSQRADTAEARIRDVEAAAAPWRNHPVNHLRDASMTPCASCVLRDALLVPSTCGQGCKSESEHENDCPVHCVWAPAPPAPPVEGER